MCGILCLLSLSGTPSKLSEELKKILSNRGPDLKSTFQDDCITFHGFVLWQQGRNPFPQPAISINFVLLLNGDIFNTGKDSSISDTEWLLNEFEKCKNEISVLEVFKKLQGPYSLMVFNREKKILYIARDPLGRNSLLLEKGQGFIQISSSSVLSNNFCIELPPVGVYKIEIGNLTQIELFKWKDISKNQVESIETIFNLTLVIKNQTIKINFLQEIDFNNYYNFYDVVTVKDFEFSHLLENPEIEKTVLELIELLKKSIKDRITNTPNYCASCIKTSTLCNHSKIGILFSGGLDCSILAALSNKFCPISDSIDLINVAFEPVSNKSDNINWNTPDRITAIKSYEELCTLFPNRNWNLVLVNVTRKELAEILSTHINNLIYPLNTILDESLGASFWFASRGLSSDYQTSCRVILVGSGADELFGGYTRHRNAFTRAKGDLATKMKAVEDELKMDWDRIAFRNLGRDDRIIADNKKTARSPYIEENLVQFITNLKAEQKCCFLLPQGIGDKLLLRLCGYKLGLKFSSTLQKRAIQFGSKIADKKQNATDISKYLSMNS